MTRSPSLGLALALLGSASCGYYNGMWSANHFAAQARRQERAGRAEEARASWAQAAVKAESVLAHHPRSRWADDALVLEGEALSRSGACSRSAAPLARALASVKDSGLRERAILATAECDLDAQDASAAEQRLGSVTGSADRQRGARAAYLSGRAAELRGDPIAAAGWYARSSEPQAGPARARVLLAAGQTDAAVALVDTLAGGHVDAAVWPTLLAGIGNPEAASGALDRLLSHGRVLTGSRARLLLADGDRLFAAGALPAADARYRQVAALVPDSTEGQQALVRQLRVLAAWAESLPQLRAVKSRLDGLARSGMVGAAANDGRALERLIQPLLALEDADDALQFRAAELARDSLRAPQLAGSVFVGLARARPASLFAPKALVAAAALLPERRDSLFAVLQSAYTASPYTLAVRGETSPAYAAAEDSLARALGIVVEPPAMFIASFVLPPVPGPRGPPLDVAGPGRAEPPRVPRGLPVRGDEEPVPDRRRPDRSAQPPHDLPLPERP